MKYERSKVGSVLTALTEAVQARFSQDPVKPGVVISSLGDGRTYASVRRFNPSEVVCAVTMFSTVEYAIRSLAKVFHRDFSPPPVQDAFAKLKAVL